MMSTPRTFNVRAVGFVAALTLILLSGCGGGDGGAAAVTSIADPTATTSVATPEPTTTAALPTEPGSDLSDSPTSNTSLDAAPETTAAPRPYGSFALTTAASGSNPVLAWDAVEGAVLYRLVVRDADGRPYWAWSGSDSSVAVGGSAEPTAVGARVFTDMTWQVSAHDASGLPIAVSDVGTLSP